MKVPDSGFRLFVFFSINIYEVQFVGRLERERFFCANPRIDTRRELGTELCKSVCFFIRPDLNDHRTDLHNRDGGASVERETGAGVAPRATDAGARSEK
ncbi:hypothetical protein EVAR_69753_1 [Eumeta japonica]|uniref:Uncharacterized protein n=1 Tax=Eumeta variegata TaxID=151549 RepID=A0A4C1T4A2_EUMVA|nr:hypothetical protein EVAR_69753_1 [Eumeta japonica]